MRGQVTVKQSRSVLDKMRFMVTKTLVQGAEYEGIRNPGWDSDEYFYVQITDKSREGAIILFIKMPLRQIFMTRRWMINNTREGLYFSATPTL